MTLGSGASIALRWYAVAADNNSLQSGDGFELSAKHHERWSEISWVSNLGFWSARDKTYPTSGITTVAFDATLIGSYCPNKRLWFAFGGGVSGVSALYKVGHEELAALDASGKSNFSRSIEGGWGTHLETSLNLVSLDGVLCGMFLRRTFLSGKAVDT